MIWTWPRISFLCLNIAFRICSCVHSSLERLSTRTASTPNSRIRPAVSATESLKSLTWEKDGKSGFDLKSLRRLPSKTTQHDPMGCFAKGYWRFSRWQRVHNFGKTLGYSSLAITEYYWYVICLNSCCRAAWLCQVKINSRVLPN